MTTGLAGDVAERYSGAADRLAIGLPDLSAEERAAVIAGVRDATGDAKLTVTTTAKGTN